MASRFDIFYDMIGTGTIDSEVRCIHLIRLVNG